ncbi:hypothetical protein AB6D11_06555 [Vibrio splendidus]
MKNSIITITVEDLYGAAFDQYFDISYIDDEVNIENTVNYIKAYAENAYDSTNIRVNNLTDEIAEIIANYFVTSHKLSEDLDDVTYNDVKKAEKEFYEISGFEV